LPTPHPQSSLRVQRLGFGSHRSNIPQGASIVCKKFIFCNCEPYALGTTERALSES